MIYPTIEDAIGKKFFMGWCQRRASVGKRVPLLVLSL
jgi:hypothetical protein